MLRAMTATAAQPDEAQTAPAKPQAPLPGAGTPDGDKLARAHLAFEAGNFLMVRELAAALTEGKNDEVAADAKQLLARIGVDPVQVGAVLACLGIFLFLVFKYVL